MVTDATDPNKIVRIALDLGSTIPEADRSLEKVDLGDLTLAYGADDPKNATPFATLPTKAYGKRAYEERSGVLDILPSAFTAKVTAADLDRGVVVLVAGVDPGDDAQPALVEAEYTAETDERGVYVDEPGAAGSSTNPGITIQVRRRGRKPSTPVQLRIAQYSPWPPMFNEMSWSLVSDGAATQPQPYLAMAAGQPVVDGAYVTITLPKVNDKLPYATARLSVSGLRPGPALLRFTVAPTIGPDAPPPGLHFDDLVHQAFANVRVLPYHNAMAASYDNWLRGGPSVDLATQRVWDAVFRTYALMYPAMRFIRDPLQFQAQRGRILAVTDPARFEEAGYMPVTRPLSAGQRAMLVAWSTYVDGTLTTRKQEAPRGRRA